MCVAKGHVPHATYIMLNTFRIMCMAKGQVPLATQIMLNEFSSYTSDKNDIPIVPQLCGAYTRSGPGGTSCIHLWVVIPQGALCGNKLQTAQSH